MRQRIWIIVGLLLVLSLALAGCGSKMTAEEIVAKMRETLNNTEDAHVVVSAELNASGKEISGKAEVWEKSPNMFRAEVLEASQPEVVGAVLVSDGEQGWYYDPGRNKVMIGEVDELETPLPQQMLAELQEVIQGVLDNSDVELLGEEEVVGRDAYVLALSAKEDAEHQIFPGNGLATIWVDKEQWFILKATYEADVFGQGSMVVESFELNPGLADDLFSFQVPEGAEVVTVEPQEIVPLTLEEAQAQAEFPLLVPDYTPGGATLVEVFRTNGSFILRYDHSPEVSFAIVQGNELSELAPLETQVAEMTAQVKDVTVRNLPGKAIIEETGGNTVLYWTENDVAITVVGHISLDEALQVAESLK